MSYRNALALCAVAVACQDSQAPRTQSLSDPLAVVTELAQFDATFASAVCSTYDNSSFLIVNPLGGALPLAPPGRLIADERLGTTFEMDTIPYTRFIATGRPGAPVNGVRFILLRLTEQEVAPVEPRVELGSVDFLDESAGSALRLRVRTSNADASHTCLDYSADINRMGEDFTATATGSAQNGAAGAASRSLSFAASWVETAAARTSSVSFTPSSPSISVTLSESRTSPSGSINIELDFRLSRPGEVVRIAGTQRLDIQSPSGDRAALNVTVNDGAFARGEGSVIPLVTWTKHDNAALSAAEIGALDALLWSAFSLFVRGDNLRAPMTRLFAAPLRE